MLRPILPHLALLLGSAALALTACSAADECATSGDCPAGEGCFEGKCKAARGAPTVDGLPNSDPADPFSDARPDAGEGEGEPPPRRDTGPPPARDSGPPPGVDAGPPPPQDTGPAVDADAGPPPVDDAGPIRDVAPPADADGGPPDAAADGGDVAPPADADIGEPGCEVTCEVHGGTVDWGLTCEPGDRVFDFCDPQFNEDQPARVIRNTCLVTYEDTGRTYRMVMIIEYEEDELYGTVEVSLEGERVGICAF